MKKEKRTFGTILMALVIAFFYLPIVYMVIFSFNSGKSLTSFTGFSLRWYKHMMESHTMMESLSTTFSIALIATAVSHDRRNNLCDRPFQIKKDYPEADGAAQQPADDEPGDCDGDPASCCCSSHSGWKKVT